MTKGSERIMFSVLAFTCKKTRQDKAEKTRQRRHQGLRIRIKSVRVYLQEGRRKER